MISDQKQTGKPSLLPKKKSLSKSPLTSSSSSSRNPKRNSNPNAKPDVLKQLEEFRENCFKGQNFEGKLKPSDIKLSSAMAMSAAAISPHIGKYESEEEKVTHFLTICGLEMAGNLVSHMREKKCNKVRLARQQVNFVVYEIHNEC